MSRRHHRIVLAAATAVALITAMAGPASARASAIGQASTPVAVNVTGDITWTVDWMPIQSITGDDLQTGTFHIDLTDVTDGGAAVGGNNSTYSVSDNENYTATDSNGCTGQTTATFSGSGSLPYQAEPYFITVSNSFLHVTINPPPADSFVIPFVTFPETYTNVSSGPSPCGNGTSTSTGQNFVSPFCVPSTGFTHFLSGTFQGTYPNGTLDIGCSGTYTSSISNISAPFSLTGTLTITPSNAATQLAFTQQPSSTATVGQPFSVQPQVAVEDANGNTVTSDSSTVTLSVGAGSTGSGKLTCTGGLTQAAVNGVASFSGCYIDAAGTYIIHAKDGALTPADSNSTAANCQLDPNSVSIDLTKNPQINALFVPSIQGSTMTLSDAARACGFAGFDWVQFVVQVPGPSDLYAVNAPTQPVVIPPGATTQDPPLGGWTYCDPNTGTGRFCRIAYPFYYPRDVVTTCLASSLPGCDVIMPDSKTLHFFDTPFDDCIGSTPVSNDPNICKGTRTGPQYLEFQTQLVGICQDAPAPVCNASGAPSSPIFQWGWSSNFNGFTGGISGFYTIPINLNPPVPGSGTGGITITSLNGVPQTPPSVSCSATPSILWPPDGKSVVVTVSGTITPGTQGIPSGGTTYAVTDEYGQVQPTGSIALGAGGSYSFGIPLVASRDGGDKDGRTYVISVRATDTIGNVGSCSATVTVPHDQGQ